MYKTMLRTFNDIFEDEEDFINLIEPYLYNIEVNDWSFIYNYWYNTYGEAFFRYRQNGIILKEVSKLVYDIVNHISYMNSISSLEQPYSKTITKNYETDNTVTGNIDGYQVNRTDVENIDNEKLTTYYTLLKDLNIELYVKLDNIKTILIPTIFTERGENYEE